jgi:hypothetical protein
MTEVLRYIALSLLRQDEVFFKEQLLSWLDTILVAYKRTAPCAMAYRYLEDAIASNLSPLDANLISPFLKLVIQSLQSHT